MAGRSGQDSFLGILGLLGASAMAFSSIRRRKDYLRRGTHRKAHRRGAEEAEDTEGAPGKPG